MLGRFRLIRKAQTCIISLRVAQYAGTKQQSSAEHSCDSSIAPLRHLSSTLVFLVAVRMIRPRAFVTMGFTTRLHPMPSAHDQESDLSHKREEFPGTASRSFEIMQVEGHEPEEQARVLTIPQPVREYDSCSHVSFNWRNAPLSLAAGCKEA